MEIDDVRKLRAVEKQIRVAVQQYRLDEVLTSLRQMLDKLPPFAVGGIALFAIRYSTAGHRTKTSRTLEWNTLAPLCNLVMQYLTADPLGFDQDIQQDYYSSNPVFTFLRIAGSQMPYAVNLFGQYARPLILFHEIPHQLAKQKGIDRFGFETKFRELNGVPPLDFIKVGFTAFAAAQSHAGFTRGYFDVARSQGLLLPGDREISLVLDNLAADPKKLRRLHRKFRVSDRRFAMYDFNPLFIHPIVRPWRQRRAVSMEQDRLTAPLPNLIAFRISMGIFYQMFNSYLTDFSNYFGYVFETYIGQLLRESIPAARVLSEEEIRRTYPATRGRVPDWMVVKGKTAVLIECKATRFSRAALTTGFEKAVDDSLTQVLKGLRQIHSFVGACEAKTPGLEDFHQCTTFRPVLVTLEPLYMINSDLFRTHINQLLGIKGGMAGLPWTILAMDELEKLQPHLAAGVELDKVLDDRRDKPLNEILEEIHSQTGLTYKDSFLYMKEQALYRQLGYSPGAGAVRKD